MVVEFSKNIEKQYLTISLIRNRTFVLKHETQKMRTTLLSIALILLTLGINAQGLRITEVNPSTSSLTITNFGAGDVDLSLYRLCSLFDYDQLGSGNITILEGDLMLSSLEELSVSWNTTGMNPTGSDLGLYLPMGGFDNFVNMVDFVQWGSAGNGRESVANTAGFWVSGTFLEGDAPYTYIGNGSDHGVGTWQSSNVGGSTTIVINEIDSDNTGTDNAEFIELYGPSNEALDGMVIVFLNGNNNSSYHAQDLDGFSLNGDGFFLMGNPGVAGSDVTFADNLLQNGQDGVALYYGNAEDWPNGTIAVANNLIDLVVYETSDADDPELLALLNPGQPQVDEWANGFAAGGVESNSRVPDGGIQLNTDTYVQQAPTPGFSNLIECIGAQIETTGSETAVVACINYPEALVQFVNTSTAQGANYIYIITDDQNSILQVLAGDSYDFALESTEGICRVWGLSYTGTLDETTLEVGDDATMIASDACTNLSSNFIAVDKQNCAPDTCEGAEINSNMGNGSILVCLDEDADLVSFSNNSSTTEANYLYLITDTDGVIIDSFETGDYDFNSGDEGLCRVWGLSFTGTLTPGTFDPGMPASGITTDGDCTSLSTNFITMVKQVCVTEGGCTDIFISEYLEGSSFNKSIELYNPTDLTIDLSEYQMLLYPNGATVGINPLTLSGMLAPGDVYVVSNSQASAIILNQTDVTASVVNFNGNDALELLHNGIVIDVIGNVGENPTDEIWVVGTGSTAEHTLVRKIDVTQGTNSWALSANQWNVFPQDYFTSLGNHTTFPCVQTPQVTFTASTLNVSEDAGTISFGVQGFNLEADLTVNISLQSATATEVDDYGLTLPITAVIGAMETEPQLFTVTIVDDLLEELTENIVITLTNDDGVEVSVGVLTINIIDNDSPIVLVDIAVAAEIDGDGVAVNLGTTYELRGIVHGVNLRPAGLQFTLIDDTDGIGIYSSADNFGYTVLEGDSIHVIGEVDQFSGLAQIALTEMTYISSGNEIDQPLVVTELNEDTESHVIQLDCVSLTDLSQWLPAGAGFTVTVTDGTNEYELRIDADVDLFNADPPLGSFSVAGIGGQFDSSIPYTEGYQLLPRYAADITPGPNAEFSLNDFGEGACITVNEGVFLVDVEAFYDGAESYSWEMDFNGEIFTSTGQTATLTGTTTFTEGSIDVTLTVVDAGCTSVQQITFCGDYIGVEEHGFSLDIYPNPTTSNLFVESSSGIVSYKLMNQVGQIVANEQVNNSTRLQVDISDLRSGVYMLQVETALGVKVSRVLKQ